MYVCSTNQLPTLAINLIQKLIRFTNKIIFPSTEYRAGIVFIKVNASIGLSLRETVAEPEASLVIQRFSPGIECMICGIQGVESVNGDDTTYIHS